MKRLLIDKLAVFFINHDKSQVIQADDDFRIVVRVGASKFRSFFCPKVECLVVDWFQFPGKLEVRVQVVRLGC